MTIKLIDALRMAVFTVFIINGFVIFYAVHFKLVGMEALLRRSRYVQDINTRLLWAGYYGRLIRMGTVSGCLLFAPFWVRRGLLDPADLAEFPKGLKLLAVVPLVVVMVGFAAMWILGAIKG